MPNNNITQITPPRVPLVDPQTGLITREWYRFFLNLYTLTGSGTDSGSTTDIQVSMPPSAPIGELERDKDIDGLYASLPPPTQLGTIASQNADNANISGNVTLKNADANCVVYTDTNKKLITSTNFSYAGFNPVSYYTYQVQSNIGSQGFDVKVYVDSTGAGQSAFYKSRGTIDSPTRAQTGDSCGFYRFFARDFGGSDREIARFSGVVETSSASAADTISGQFRFATRSYAAGVPTAPVTRVTIASTGLMTSSYGLSLGAPVTKTGDFTVADTENFIISNRGATNTVTLPTAADWDGRIIIIKTIQAFTVISASSNVVPSTSATAGTAILPATDGAWAMLVSDGTNWVIMAANPLV